MPISHVDAQETALEPSFSYPSVVQGGSNNIEQVDTTQDINTSGGALLPTVSNLGTAAGSDTGDSPSDQVSVYVVRKNDSINKIADMFSVSVNTILWANDMKKGDKLVEGDTLFILPVSGVKHVVIKGQTLKGIAKKYNVDVVDIAGFNGIPSDSQLAVGDELIIPDGVISDSGVVSTVNNKKYHEPKYTTNISNYFINPVPGAYLSQGIHDRGAVDLAISKGTPIYAAASGKVIFAKMGWNGAFGGLVIINHSNGTQTLYAHQSKIATHAGDEVHQGEIIGYVGSTGHSTGPHLHFEVHGAKNPGVNGSWKY